MIKKITSLALLMSNVACVSLFHGHYPKHVTLTDEGMAVFIMEKKYVVSCRRAKDVSGYGQSTWINSAVSIALNDARNKAAIYGINTLVYDGAVGQRDFVSHFASVDFKGYSCPEYVGDDSAQKDWEAKINGSVDKRIRQNADAAGRAAMNATQASAAAAAAAAMHHHPF